MAASHAREPVLQTHSARSTSSRQRTSEAGSGSGAASTAPLLLGALPLADPTRSDPSLPQSNSTWHAPSVICTVLLPPCSHSMWSPATLMHCKQRRLQLSCATTQVSMILGMQRHSCRTGCFAAIWAQRGVKAWPDIKADLELDLLACRDVHICAPGVALRPAHLRRCIHVPIPQAGMAPHNLVELSIVELRRNNRLEAPLMACELWHLWRIRTTPQL